MKHKLSLLIFSFLLNSTGISAPIPEKTTPEKTPVLKEKTEPATVLKKEDTSPTDTEIEESTVPESPAIALEATTPATPETDSKEAVPAEPSYETAEGDNVKYLVPYKPKALGIIPPRWRVEEVPEIVVANDNVGLNNGTTTTLRVNAYRIIPNRAEGVVSFREPSFDPNLGINQKETLSVVLAESSRRLKASEQLLERTASSLEETIVLAAEASKKLNQEKAKAEASRGKPPALPKK